MMVIIGGLFASGDKTVFNWLRLTFRFSNLDNDFWAAPDFVAPSVAWDWRKYDFGGRVGIVRDLDLKIPGDPRDLAPEVCLHVGVVQEQNVVPMPFGPPSLGLPHT